MSASRAIDAVIPRMADDWTGSSRKRIAAPCLYPRKAPTDPIIPEEGELVRGWFTVPEGIWVHVRKAHETTWYMMTTTKETRFEAARKQGSLLVFSKAGWFLRVHRSSIHDTSRGRL